MGNFSEWINRLANFLVRLGLPEQYRLVGAWVLLYVVATLVILGFIYFLFRMRHRGAAPKKKMPPPEQAAEEEKSAEEAGPEFPQAQPGTGGQPARADAGGAGENPFFPDRAH